MIFHRFSTIAWFLLIASVTPLCAENAAPTPNAKVSTQTGLRELKDIPYVTGGKESQWLDLYLPPQGSPARPLVIWIHGGAWSGGDKSGCPAKWLLDHGYAVASLNYRFIQTNIYPAQIEDCKAAIRFLRAHAAEYGILPDKIGAWGESAGGHLVALLATTGDIRDFDTGENLDQSSRVQCVVDWYGPTDFLHYGEPPLSFEDKEANYKKSVINSLLGGSIIEKPEAARKASPFYFVQKQTAPFLIMHGDKDPLVPLQQSQRLNEALKNAGVESTLQIFPGAGHGGAPFQTFATFKVMFDFFQRHLMATPPEASAQDAIRELKDIPYVTNGHERQRLDLYLAPQGQPARPLVIWIHGGAWSGGDKSGGPVKGLLAHGYSVASLGYRFTQDAIYPAQIEDCKAAVRFIRAHAAEYGILPDKIGAWGESAGGHLAALLATTGNIRDFDKGENLDQSSGIQCVIDWYGRADFVHYGEPQQIFEDKKASVNRLLGGSVIEKPDVARRASPLYFVQKEAAPFLIMQGDKDPLVPLEQNQRLNDALQKAGVESTLQIFPGSGHGGPAFHTPEAVKTMFEFFDRHLMNK